MATSTPLFQTSGLQNCERKKFGLSQTTKFVSLILTGKWDMAVTNTQKCASGFRMEQYVETGRILRGDRKSLHYDRWQKYGH
jgi:hypothetical protein